MIQTEICGKWIDGTNLIRTWSDIHHYIANDQGIKYEEAIDPEIMHRVYTETDEPIDDEVPAEIALEELLEVINA